MTDRAPRTAPKWVEPPEDRRVRLLGPVVLVWLGLAVGCVVFGWWAAVLWLVAGSALGGVLALGWVLLVMDRTGLAAAARERTDVPDRAMWDREASTWQWSPDAYRSAGCPDCGLAHGPHVSCPVTQLDTYRRRRGAS